MRLYLIISLLFLSGMAFGQAESYKPKTYIDTITEFSGNGPQDPTRYGVNYLVMITIPDSTDSRPRPALICMPGAGEVGLNPANATAWGVHYWLNHSWNDSLVLGNGLHRPVLITVCQGIANLAPWHTLAIMDSIVIRFPQINRKAMNFADLSEGGHEWKSMLCYYDPVAAPNDTCMKMIHSLLDLQGQGPDYYFTGTDTFTRYGANFTKSYQLWDTAYGGRYASLEGTSDSRGLYLISQAMNTVKSNTGYWCLDSTNGGAHCCWNTFYSPSITNWTDSGSGAPGNLNLFLSTSPQSTPGNYKYVSSTGSNFFQWMLRQSDTTLVGSVTNPWVHNAQTQKLYTGEYVTPWIDSAGNARSLTSNLSLAGTGGTGTAGLPGLISTPGTTFHECNNLLHGMIFVADADSSVWTAGGNDQGQCGQGSFTSPITTLTKIPFDTLGNPVHGITRVQGFYVNNTSEGFFAVKYNPTTDTILGCGDLEYGMAMSGSAGHIATKLYPLFWRTGHHIIDIVASKAYAIVFDDGAMYTGGAGGVYIFLGYVGTGSQYLTPHVVTGFDDSVRHVVGGDIGGFVAKTKTGKFWGFGPHAGYLGNAGDPSYATPHDLTDSVISYILNGTTRTSILEFSANSDAFHYVANDSTEYGHGDNGQGSIGNGIEANMVSPGGTSTPWSIDPAAVLVLAQTHPVQVTKKHNFIKLFNGTLFGFTHFSLDANGQIYGNGRNKGAVLGNGVIECVGANGDISATYSNSWDLPYCTPITPYSLTVNIPASCPGCKTGAVTTYCSECTIPTTTPTANAGSSQSLASVITATSLDGSSSTCTGGKITYYLWTQVSGAASTIDVPASPKINVSGLVPGVYVFNLSVKDNAFNTSNQNVTVTINAAIGGNNITICPGCKIKIQ